MWSLVVGEGRCQIQTFVPTSLYCLASFCPLSLGKISLIHTRWQLQHCKHSPDSEQFPPNTWQTCQQQWFGPCCREVLPPPSLCSSYQRSNSKWGVTEKEKVWKNTFLFSSPPTLYIYKNDEVLSFLQKFNISIMTCIPVTGGAAVISLWRC